MMNRRELLKTTIAGTAAIALPEISFGQEKKAPPSRRCRSCPTPSMPSNPISTPKRWRFITIAITRAMSTI